MLDKLEEIEARYLELNRLLSRQDILSKQDEYQKLSREHAALGPQVQAFQRYRQVLKELEENRELFRSETGELKEMAAEEINRLEGEKTTLHQQLRLMLLPRDPNDEKNILLEIRAGAGGDEAGLFAADLFRMYARYAEQVGWKVEILSQNQTGVGGFKEVIAMIKGDGVYSRLKYERGVHRVQRIPVTESGGRIHTSTVTVAVLPEAEDVDVSIDEKDLRIDVFRSSGPGGQSVNTTDSAVRVTHLPSGIVVQCQDEKSQLKNKLRAMKILRARLLEREQEEQRRQISEDRRSQVGTGDRSERIRTYNYPQGRVTDHRIGLTLHRLSGIMEGELDALIDPLVESAQSNALKRSDADRGGEVEK